METPNRSRVGRVRDFFVTLLIVSARRLPEDREAMWSVPRPFKHAYFALMVVFCTPPLVVIIVEQTAAIKPQLWLMNVIVVIIESATRFAPVGLGVAVAMLVIVHIGAIVMSLYHVITNRFAKPVIESHEARGREQGRQEGMAEGRQEGMAEGRQEGRAEGHTAERAAWRDWLNRKNAAGNSGASL